MISFSFFATYYYYHRTTSICIKANIAEKLNKTTIFEDLSNNPFSFVLIKIVSDIKKFLY